MDHRVPRLGVRLSLVIVLLSIATFVFLNHKFEGPADPLDALSDATRLTATFTNTKKLPTKQPVLFKGYPVGRVTAVEWDPETRSGRVRFSVDPDFELHEDAVVRVGERSLIGDPFLDVVTRGSRGAPKLSDGDAITNTRTSVNFDEALDFLGSEGRGDVKSVLRTVSRGARSRAAGEQLNGTVGGLALTVTEAHQLTRALRGQEEQIGRLVTGAGTVLAELSSREESIRTIVASGRSTLGAVAADTAALEDGLTELPLLLESGRRSLDAARPLVSELRPPIRKLRALAPDVSRALAPGPRSLRAGATDLAAVIDDLPALRRAAVPALDEDIRPLVKLLGPLVRSIEPASRSLVPALEYLASGKPGTSRAEAIAGLYAAIGAATKGKLGSRGHYTRAGFSLDLNEATDTPVDDCPSRGYCNNAYPDSGDGLDPQPFTGEYPRVTECVVPPRSRPRDPCK